jgi:hypothetical protein
MKNSSDTIGNRTCDLPVCSVVARPIAPQRGPLSGVFYSFLELAFSHVLHIAVLPAKCLILLCPAGWYVGSMQNVLSNCNSEFQNLI